LILFYWSIARDILIRQHDEGWGARIIDRLAADLHRDSPEMTGLSARNLKYMRAFAEAHSDSEFVQQVVAQMPWGHNIRFVEAIRDPAEREWYAGQVIEHGWSRNVLIHQIESGLFHRHEFPSYPHDFQRSARGRFHRPRRFKRRIAEGVGSRCAKEEAMKGFEAN
jgi:predicted nuclease of restriction endonuclease-like (RecB) superfamily